MVTRRNFILSTSIAAGLSACRPAALGRGDMSYEEAVREIWRPAGGDPDDASSLLRELVRNATLAASSHNTQCWKFRIGEQSIAILPDWSRRTPVVDPDDHHLFVSLGCAAENLIHAALAHGLAAEPAYDAGGGGDALKIILTPVKPAASPLFGAIPKRQCTRSEYAGTALAVEELKQLEQAGAGNGVRVLLLTGKTDMEKVLEYAVAGNTAQMGDPAFVRELKAWIRFSDGEAVRTRDGLFSRSSGNPSVPRWLGEPLFNLLVTAKNENEKYARQVRSSSGIAVFTSEADDRTHWIEVGRCYQRFALQATALGIRNAFLNQPVEVSALRPQFMRFLGIGTHRPDLVVRFGRGPEMPRSLRRPVEAVLA